MNNHIAEEILLRYKEGKASAEEKALVDSWMLYGAEKDLDLTEDELLEDLVSIRSRIDFNPPKQLKRVLWQRVAVAASIILVSCLALLVYLNPDKKSDTVTVADKRPGTNAATLTLSDGTEIQLNKIAGNITKERGLKITNDTAGNLVYNFLNTANQKKKLAFNTVTTPRGGQYKIILPDGTGVWLNAASSLRFPVAFSEDSRRVELTGEGYFEVAKSNKKFEVITDKASIEVLGTHFNVNAYDNESRNSITLLEGSVKVKNAKSSVIIKPGEQAGVMTAVSTISISQGVDTEVFTAWKDGVFQFSNTSLKEIMNQLERWYDVDVDDNIPAKKFNGTISRNVKLSEVLAMIELTSNLQFKIEGRRIIMSQ